MPPPLPRLLRSPLHLSSLATCAKTLVWASALAIFLNDNVLAVAPIKGTSMKPTLSPRYDETQERDIVLFQVWGAHRDLRRGDVAHFMSPNKPEQFAVKRVIALPGDTVILDPRRRPKVAEGPEPTAAKAWDSLRGRVVVPPGHVWVEGDNWRSSSDSNWYGPISKSLITGKATAVLFPSARFWSKPWKEWKGGRTRVIEGRAPKDWTKEGLPVELAEIGDLGLPKG